MSSSSSSSSGGVHHGDSRILIYDQPEILPEDERGFPVPHSKEELHNFVSRCLRNSALAKVFPSIRIRGAFARRRYSEVRNREISLQIQEPELTVEQEVERLLDDFYKPEEQG